VRPEDHLREDRLAAARLVELDFDDAVAPTRVWQGVGTLRTDDGREWTGMGVLGSISPLEAGADLSASPFTVGLRNAAEGVETDFAAFNAAVAAERRRDVYGRRIRVYLQVLDIDTGAPVGEPIAEAVGMMSHISTARVGPSEVSITVHCEGLFAEGHKPPHGRYTDADQRARYPGDPSLEFIAANADRNLTWPRD